MQTKHKGTINYKETGITLVALVVTIIAILVLAGITLYLALGDQGLLGRAQTASNTMAEATRNEMAMMDEYVKTIDDETSIRLPEEYQRVEYLESTGTQWIDTGIILYENYGLDLEAMIKYENYTSYIGATKTARAQVESLAIVAFDWQGKKFLTTDMQRTTPVGEWDNYVNARHKFSIREGHKIYIDDIFIKEYNFIYNSEITNSATIFWVKGSRFNKKSKMKLYSACFYDNNNIIIGNFIPCYCTTAVTDVNGKACQSGTAGLYDTVEGKFYTNQGTGEFIVGEDV